MFLACIAGRCSSSRTTTRRYHMEEAASAVVYCLGLLASAFDHHSLALLFYNYQSILQRHYLTLTKSWTKLPLVAYSKGKSFHLFIFHYQKITNVVNFETTILSNFNNFFPGVSSTDEQSDCSKICSMAVNFCYS